MYPNAILRLVVSVHLGVAGLIDRARDSERGQSTAEYAMVLAGVVLIVAAVFAKTDVFGSFFKKAIDTVNKAIK